MKQSEKEALLSAARAEYELEFNRLSALTVEADAPPDLQIQLDAANAQIVVLQGQLVAMTTGRDDALQNAAAVQAKLDIAKRAAQDLLAALSLT